MSAEELAGEDLERSGITLNDAEAAQMFCVGDASEIYTDFSPFPALVIPYIDPHTGENVEFMRDGELLPFCRVRYLELPKVARGFHKVKQQRYSQPSDSGVRAYFPVTQNLNWQDVLSDPEIPIMITEGEKKALSGCLSGVPTIGLGGVFNFMDGDKLIPELASIDFSGRTVYICYDSDAVTNPNIQTAEGRLATELSVRRRADVFLVRLPKLAGQDKTGLDDFLVTKGVDALFDLLKAAPQMRKLDAAVLGLNSSVAWVERDGMVYDMTSGEFIRKHNFVSGSKYSALEVQAPVLKGAGGVKRLSVAEAFLTHPLARRYNDVVFDPATEAREIPSPLGVSLNLWQGWDATEGDVGPFIELSRFLFSDIQPEHADLPLKLLAYKAQNPGEKIPLALVLLGTQGCGKSFWAQIVREAFAPYGAAISSDTLVSEFNGWIEKTLVCVMDEAQSVHIRKGNDKLKNLISEKTQPLRDLYRPVRQVNSYCFFILTSNDRRVGAYSNDDRRMFIISCPKKREAAFYSRIRTWYENGGAKRVLGWLLNYDLKGWTPPQEAPMTAEKYMAYMESLTPVQRLAEEMRTADENVVKMWIDSAMEWARAHLLDDRTSVQAQEVKEALERFQIRPFYTAEELAAMFPAIVGTLHGTRNKSATPGEISYQLRSCGVPFLRSADDPRGFRWRGMWRQYLVIAEPEEWGARPLSQQEFENYMAHFPRYGAKSA